MWTGALDLVSWAGVGMPWLFSGDAGDLVIRGLDILGRLSYRERSTVRHGSVANDDENIDPGSSDDDLFNNIREISGPLTLVFSIISKAKPATERKELHVPGIQFCRL